MIAPFLEICYFVYLLLLCIIKHYCKMNFLKHFEIPN